MVPLTIYGVIFVVTFGLYMLVVRMVSYSFQAVMSRYPALKPASTSYFNRGAQYVGFTFEVFTMLAYWPVIVLLAMSFGIVFLPGYIFR